MISPPSNGATLQAYLQQILKSQGLVNQDGGSNIAGANSGAGTPPGFTGNGTLRGGGAGTPPPPGAPNTTFSGNGSLGGNSPPPAVTPPPANVAQSAPGFTSTLGSGATWNPTASLQQGLNSAQAQNGVNGIAVPPSNFARWQTYPASPAINKTYAPLGANGSAGGPGGGMGGGVPGGAPGSGGGNTVFGSNPGPIPGNPGNGSGGYTPNSGVAPGNNPVPAGSTPNQTFGGVRAPGSLNVSGQNINPQILSNFNTLMGQSPDKAYSYILAQPNGAQILQSIWQPQWNDPKTGADLYHQIVQNHVAGTNSSAYDPTAQYYGVNPATLSHGALRNYNAAMGYAAQQAAKGGK